MSNKGAQTAVVDQLMLDEPNGPSTPMPPSRIHHHDNHYDIHRRIRHQGPGRVNPSPSIRQSWLFPVHRASPSTALPETTSVMTLNQRPSSTVSSLATAQSVPPSVAMNHKERRNFSGSARSRLTKIDRISKMMLNTNATSSSNLMDGSALFTSQASPRRARLSLQPQTVPVADASRSSIAAIQASEPVSHSASLPVAPHTPTSSNFPRHVIVRSTSPHRALEDLSEKADDPDSFSSSLPSTPAFAAGMDPSLNVDSTSPISEKANRHTSMPLPRTEWRLYALPDVEEPERAHGEGSGPGSGIGDTSFQYSASNASSTTNLENHPYSCHPLAHTRQNSSSTYYTMTPNASNLDLSVNSSQTNLSFMDTPDTNQGSVSGLPPLAPKAIKNTKSPLALRRSSTVSTAASSPSNTFLNKGSFPKSSLSPNAAHANKVLTQERQRIILEILQTERSYVDGLIILQTLFYEPLNAPYANGNTSGMNTTTSLHMNNHVNGTGTTLTTAHPPYYASSTVGSNSTLSASAAPLLSKKSVGEIFSNFSEILQINTLLLTQLETRICGSTLSTGWESDEEAEDRDVPEDDDENQDHHVEQKPKQVLVSVKGQNGEQEQLVVLDTDWCVGDIFTEIVSDLVHLSVSPVALVWKTVYLTLIVSLVS